MNAIVCYTRPVGRAISYLLMSVFHGSVYYNNQTRITHITIQDVNNDHVLQVSSQEPSKSSMYRLQGQEFLTHLCAKFQLSSMN